MTDITTLNITLTVITAVVIALVKIAINSGMPKRFSPVLAIVLGIASLLGLTFLEAPVSVIFAGIVVGLSACGLYDLGKTTILGK